MSTTKVISCAQPDGTIQVSVAGTVIAIVDDVDSLEKFGTLLAEHARELRSR